MKRSVLVIALIALIAFAGTASAAKFRGDTSQKHGVMTIYTNDRNGKLRKLQIEWRAPCRYGGTVRGGTNFNPPLDQQGPQGFRDSGTYTTSSGRYKVHYRTSIEGERITRELFKGTFKIVARYTENGQYVSTCRSGQVDWRAKKVR